MALFKRFAGGPQDGIGIGRADGLARAVGPLIDFHHAAFQGSPPVGNEVEKTRPALVPDLEQVGKARGKEENGRRSRPLEEGVGTAGGREAHAAGRGIGIGSVAGENEAHAENGSLLAAKKLDGRPRGDIGRKAAIQDEPAVMGLPAGDPALEPWVCGQEQTESHGKFFGPVGRTGKEESVLGIDPRHDRGEGTPGKNLGPVKVPLRVATEAIGEGPARIHEEFP